MNTTLKETELFKPIPPMEKKSVTEMDGVSWKFVLEPY
jgi:hypothetical protein